MYHIAFVTYQKNPHLTEDDLCLVPALQRRGIQFSAIPWDDEAVNWESFDAVVVRSCWDYYLHFEKFERWLDHLENKKIKVYNHVEILRWNSSKSYLQDLEKAGIQIPGSTWLNGSSDVNLCELLKQNRWSRAILKPSISAGAFDTFSVDEKNWIEQQRKLETSLKERAFIMQEYLEEINIHGEISMMFFGNRYSHSVVKHPLPNDFRVQTKFGGTVTKYAPEPSMIHQAQRIVDYSNQKLLYSRVDGVMVKGKLVLMELELIEPCLFFSFHPQAAEHFADELLECLKS